MLLTLRDQGVWVLKSCLLKLEVFAIRQGLAVLLQTFYLLLSLIKERLEA